MTNNTTYQYSTESSQGYLADNIIPFPNLTKNNSKMSMTTSFGFTRSENAYIKELIESIVYEVMIKEKILGKTQDVNPFGSLYLCDLKPDIIDFTTIDQIKLFSNIRDISDTITFNDGMDD
jgi:hypothetical protein